MTEFLIVLAIALLPAGGSMIGSLIAECTRPPKWIVGATLHAAAGVAIAVVSVSLMPRILEESPIWLVIVSFLAGASFSVAMAKSVEFLATFFAAGGSAGAWTLYMAIAADLFSDGLMTGIGSAIDPGLGLLLGLAQLVANIPGGLGSVARFRSDGVERRTRVLIACSFAVPLFLGATAGYWILQDLGDGARNAALAFVVGILLLATVEDTLPQADEPMPPRLLSTVAFAGAFSFFALLASFQG